MRIDGSGNKVPATLGEYRDLCAAIGGEDCGAVTLLDGKIKDQGRDEEVITSDQQMRVLLMPLLGFGHYVVTTTYATVTALRDNALAEAAAQQVCACLESGVKVARAKAAQRRIDNKGF